MKKRHLTLIIMFLYLITLPFLSFVPVRADQTKMDSGDLKALEDHLRIRDLWGDNFVVKTLFDKCNEPQFLLGVTDNGYAIVDCKTYEFHEAGQKNPYKDFMDLRLFYGGPLYYYTVALDNYSKEPIGLEGFYDILRNSNEEELYTVEFYREEQLLRDSKQSPEESKSTDLKIINNAYDFLRRRAFGNNTDNTCSAVAVCIILNYLTFQTSRPFVPSNWRSEFLNKGINSNAVQSNYPFAYNFHRAMATTYGMGPASFGGGGSSLHLMNMLERMSTRDSIFKCPIPYCQRQTQSRII